MTVPIKCECPKCHADRTMLDSSFALPARHPENAANINPNCTVPVRLVMCPRCHYLEMYHDVGLGKLC